MPKVDENFFFASDDPLFQDNKKIGEMFLQVPQIIFAAKGDIHSKEYAQSIEELSQAFESLPEVLSVQSLARGPDNINDALQSPLWTRTLITNDGQATFLFAFLKGQPDAAFIEALEEIKTRFERPGFETMISGPPYIVELIRRNLFNDLKIFNLAAFTIFSLALFIIFGSLWIVAGVIVACANASALTMIVSEAVYLEMGFLTANLPTIVFVLTLSHIAFLTADWKQRIVEAGECRREFAWQAAKATFDGALWSTVTALLGFLTLLFVEAKSLKQLGLSGSIGTVVALVAAYGIYPWFLEHQDTSPKFFKTAQIQTDRIRAFFKRRHFLVLIALGALTIFGLSALPRLDTDPSLFAYFKKGSVLRNGLEYIDASGGSNPLNIVVEDTKRTELNDLAAYKKMWQLHLALEKDPAVGHVISLPILLAEAKRSFFAKLLTVEWLLNVMESSHFGEITKYFVTADRRATLFLLRMKEADLQDSRLETIERIKEIVRRHDYNPILVGGVFALQGRLSELIASSLISGSAFLNGVILIMTWLLSRSWKTAVAMLISLYFVPVTMFGILAAFKIPLDVIAAPAANVAIGMGVDSMIHLMIYAKRHGKLDSWDAWSEACAHLWDPICWSTLMVASGFSIFLFSNFPPTQRFGFSVVIGTLLSPLATLFILPWLATLSLPKWGKFNGHTQHAKK